MAQLDYIQIFNGIFYDVEEDEEMRKLITECCQLIGNIIIKYGELVNEMQYKEPESDGFVDTVVILLLRKIMEHLDAINLLIEKCSFSQANIILRALMESTASLKFILKKDTEIRAAAYFLNRHYEEMLLKKYFDESTIEGKILKARISEKERKEIIAKFEKKEKAIQNLTQKGVFRTVDDLRRNKLQKKSNKSKHVHLKWYQICSKITSIYGLIKDAGWEKYYETLYGGMSMETHGYNATTGIIPDNGELYLRVIRSPQNGFNLISLTGSFCYSALMDVYKYLKDGQEEAMEFERHYGKYINDRDNLELRFNKLLYTSDN